MSEFEIFGSSESNYDSLKELFDEIEHKPFVGSAGKLLDKILHSPGSTPNTYGGCL